MDSSAFDRLARRLAGSASRRTALTGLAAALSRLLPGTASAQPRTTCRELGQVCIPERNIDCCAGTTCRNGRCRCGEGKRRCQGECVSVRRCCGDQCPGGAVCRDGRCVCPSGSRRCGERCVSRQRCCPGQKKCGQRCIRQAACCGGCRADQVCRSGSCQCAAGAKPCNGRCIPQATCCGGCGPDQVCAGGACVAKVCGTGGPCVVFVSQTPFPGNALGGLNGADAKCQQEATESGSLAPPGVYRAWLSYQTASPQTRFVHSPGPYVLVDGTVVAANWADLTDGQLVHAINRDQAGAGVGPVVWTNTTTAGLPDNPGDFGSCSGWDIAGEVGAFGDSRSASADWTKEPFAFTCTTGAHLYCFQQS